MGFCTHRTLTQQNSSCQHLAQQLASYSRVSMSGARLSKQVQTPACKKQGVALVKWMLSLWRQPSRSRQSCTGLCMLLCPRIMATSSYPPCLVRPFSAGKALHFAVAIIAAARLLVSLCIHLSNAAQSTFTHACIQSLHCMSGPSCMLSTQHPAATGKSCDGFQAVSSNCRANITDLVSPVHQLMIWSSSRGARLSCQHLQHCLASLRYSARHLCRWFCSCKPVTARTVSLSHRHAVVCTCECVSRLLSCHVLLLEWQCSLKAFCLRSNS